MVAGPKKRVGSRKSGSGRGSSSVLDKIDECKIDFSQTQLLIIIDSISGLEASKTNNKHELKYPVDIAIRISLGEEDLGISQTYSVPDSGPLQLDYQLVYNLPKTALDLLASRPLTVTVLGSGGKEKSGGGGSQKRSSSKSGRLSKQAYSSFSSDSILMEASVDLLPILLGEVELEERVGDLLEVVIRLDGFKPALPSNLLYTTILSLYNPPVQLLTSDVSACTLDVYMTQQDVLVPKPSGWMRLHFGPGQIMSLETGEEPQPRKWFSVDSGPPAMSQYRNMPGEERMKDPGKIWTEDETKKSSVRISWNQLCRSFLQPEYQNDMISNLVKNGEWLLEVSVKKSNERKKEGKNAKVEEEPSPAGEKTLYFARLNMSDLLHPGVNCTRVVAQLEKLESNESVSHARVSTFSYDQMQETIKDGSESINHILVYDAESRPSYISVQVELYSSFRPRKSSEELLTSVKEYVQDKHGSTDLFHEIVTSCRKERSKLESQAHYRTCLLDTVHFLQQRYQEYTERDNESLNEDENYIEDLDKSGALELVKQNMYGVLSDYMSDSACSVPKGVSDAYCFILQDAAAILDEASELRTSSSEIRATADELFVGAKVSVEEGEYSQADYYMYKRFYYYGEKDANQWTDMAIVCLREGNPPKAMQSLYKAITIEPRHRDALVMLAVLNAVEGDYNIASLMFESLTSFYPQFYPGWYAYRCFFDLVENQQGSDVCLSLGSICLRNRQRDEGITSSSFWSSNLLPEEEDGLIPTAIYLLHLCLLQFAEMCLSQHRLEMGEVTQSYLYYLAVSHHLQGKFLESNSHIKEATSIAWNDERLWNLMGDNLYRVGDWDKAVDCYMFVIDNPEASPECGLTFYRLGKIMLARGLYKEAVSYLLQSIHLYPCPQAWILLAKASYWDENLEDAELAAREANRLDDRASAPWACLSLVNYRNCTHPSLAKQCLTIAKQCGIDDEALAQEIKKVLEMYD